MFKAPRVIVPTVVSPYVRRWLIAPAPARPSAPTVLDQLQALHRDQAALAADFHRAADRLLDSDERDSSHAYRRVLP